MPGAEVDHSPETRWGANLPNQTVKRHINAQGCERGDARKEERDHEGKVKVLGKARERRDMAGAKGSLPSGLLETFFWLL